MSLPEVRLCDRLFAVAVLRSARVATRLSRFQAVVPRLLLSVDAKRVEPVEDIRLPEPRRLTDFQERDATFAHPIIQGPG